MVDPVTQPFSGESSPLNSTSWDALARGVVLPFAPDLEIPELTEVRLPVPDPVPVSDVEAEARRCVRERFADRVTTGTTVAVGGGSRGLTDRVALLRGVIAGLRDLGGDPFVVPAMGSHGGGTAEGQERMLATLGVTSDSVGAEIRSTMDVVEVARTDAGMPLYLDRHAARADVILPVNRTKPHTCFKGPVESGCTKMAVVGFGKQPGAAQIHSCGPVQMRDRLLEGIAALRATGRLLGGVTTIESASGAVVEIAALSAQDVGGSPEVELTERARALVPPLPFDQIDVLIVDRGGKDISGTTMDPNVTGRFWVPGLADLDSPVINAIVLAGLTEATGGNVLGIGFADFIPAEIANRIDWPTTYLNCFTAGPSGMRRARLPMVLPDVESCIKAALSMCGRGPHEPKRVVRITSTLHLQRCWVSDALLADLPAGVEPVL
jgi:hypothetical protein